MLRKLSSGLALIVILAAVSTTLVLLQPAEPQDGLHYWTFDRSHAQVAADTAAGWNQRHPDNPMRVITLTGPTLLTRMLSGFYSDTPLGDLIEVERSQIGQVFAGPVSDIGFVDLTDRLDAEGLRDLINAPSLSPWSMHGRIYGLPHDVHPTMLLYRSDLVEAAGIDVNGIETWDDYFRALRPLMRDRDGDGRPDTYLLNTSPTNLGNHEVMLLQAGGGLFDKTGQPTLNSEINVQTVARLVVWLAGPNRMTADAAIAGPSAIKLANEGYMLAFIAPDWLAGAIRKELPNLAGKFKVMPLPAWSRGGRRTSVLGGTMVGLTKASRHPDEAWDFAKHLYFAPETARRLYATYCIVSPIKANWALPCYDEPDPYFSGQPVGRLYLNLAGDVPERISSPFYAAAGSILNAAMVAICRQVDAQGITDPKVIEPEVRSRLDAAQAEMRQLMQRNVFLSRSAP